ncbi:hypothetical protein [Stieleria mannarensis]|uniref:hypothetical protein n=1 Tax=Stieleria mannarensis TaxID=2755585 RepID=UPI0015FF8468|nr:hypothetical protein [Rhodopirellula sp. JC639]
MSVITIHITKPTDLPTLVRAIRPATGQSIAQIKSCIDNNTPIFEHELFLNDFADLADTLRQLVAALTETDAEFIICESGDVISDTTLFNILEGSEQYRL